MSNNVQSGPKAPKDPQKKRSGFYIMIDKMIEATARNEGKPSQELYLDENRLASNASFVGEVKDKEILECLNSWEGAKKIIHSIGVSVSAPEEVEHIDFVYYNYGKKDVFGGGTRIKVPCTNDGAERIINFADYEFSEDDDVVGKIAFEFEKPGLSAKATVKFYLKDGYEVPDRKSVV